PRGRGPERGGRGDPPLRRSVACLRRARLEGSEGDGRGHKGRARERQRAAAIAPTAPTASPPGPGRVRDAPGEGPPDGRRPHKRDIASTTRGTPGTNAASNTRADAATRPTLYE